MKHKKLLFILFVFLINYSFLANGTINVDKSRWKDIETRSLITSSAPEIYLKEDNLCIDFPQSITVNIILYSDRGCIIYNETTPTIIINNRLLFNSGSYKEISNLLNIELNK